MALHQNIQWEVRTTGNEANGGGFKLAASGTDRSQQDSPQATLSAASVVHTTTSQLNVSAGDYTVSATDVGNLVQLAGGTATAGFYEITTVDVPNNRWTVDRGLGTAGQTCTGRMGGALASLGKLGSAAYVGGNTVWIKAGTYAVSSATTNISGGTFFDNSRGIHLEGFQTTHGDLSTTKPLLQAGAIASFILINVTTNNAHRVSNLTLDGAARTSSQGLAIRGFAYRVDVLNCTNSAFTHGGGVLPVCVACSATGCSSQPAFMNVHAVNCVAYANTVAGFSADSEVGFTTCIAAGNTGASTDGFLLSGSSKDLPVVHCVAASNGRDGFRVPSQRGAHLVNCIAEANTGWGYHLASAGVGDVGLQTCAAFNNTLGTVTTGGNPNIVNEGFLTGTSTFFVNAATYDFALNATAGGGALLRGAGVPGVFPAIPSTGAPDVGAVQVTSGGGGAAAEHAHTFVGLPV